MAETKRTITFSTYADTGAGSAWGVGNSTPAFPTASHGLGGDPPRINGGSFTRFSGSGNCIIYDKAALTGAIIASEISNIGSLGGDAKLLTLSDASGNGYECLITNTQARFFVMTAWVLQGSAIYTLTYSTTASTNVRFEREGNVLRYFAGGVERGSHTVAGGISITDWRAGAGIRGNTSITSLTSAYTPAQTVDSFNGANDIVVGQQDVDFVTTGFPGGVVSAITTNAAGVSVSGIVLTAPNDGTGTADISGFVEGVAYPILPATIEHTFANGGATAKITKQHNLQPGYSQVSYLNAIAPSDRVFAWHLQQAGISIANGTRVIWPDTPGFSFDANGDTTSDALRTVTAWVRDIATGLMSEWIVTIDDAGKVVVVTRGLSAVGLDDFKLVAVGLKAFGL